MLRIRSLAFLWTALLLAAMCAPRSVRAQAMLINGFGGTVGYGTACLSPNDDGSSNSIDITSAFPSGLRFFGGTYHNMYVNTNGNITFSGPVSVYTPNPFPVAGQPMIAPYWADVDIRPSNSTCGGYLSSTGSPGNGPCLNPSSNGAWWHLEAGRIIVTWDHVGYFLCHTNHIMNFQLILTAAPGCSGSGGGDFDVEFRYNLCQWETGDASGGAGGFGGTQAQAGFDAGDRTNYVAIPGSRAAGIAAHLCSGSNITPASPGIWRFQVRGGTVMCPDAGMMCNTGRPGICADGRQQCVGSGTMCVGLTGPQPSQCNGLDNNCDGMIDTGPCPAGQVCDGAQCVSRCVEGGCNPGQVCTTQGTCIDMACQGVTCAGGQRCVNGMCVGACDGVTCPADQVCRLGSCVDPCSGLTCGMGQVCEAGTCVPQCPCRMCAAGQTCATGGHCVESACATVTCGAGTVCRGGACVDACMGAVCPMGGICQMGNCAPNPAAQDAGTIDDSSVPLGDVYVPPHNDAGTLADGAHVDAGRSDARRDGSTTPVNNGGCACRTAGAPGRTRSVAPLGIMLALAGCARRRRRSGSA